MVMRMLCWGHHGRRHSDGAKKRRQRHAHSVLEEKLRTRYVRWSWARSPGVCCLWPSLLVVVLVLVLLVSRSWSRSRSSDGIAAAAVAAV